LGYTVASLILCLANLKRSHVLNTAHVVPRLRAACYELGFEGRGDFSINILVSFEV
jgi:hypothetical protein